MATHAVAEFLGGPAVFKKVIDTDLGLALEVEKGFPSASLGHVMQRLGAGFEQKTLYAIVGNARTLQRKRRDHTRLSRDESDRLARLGRMHQRAVEALGSEEKAHRWLARPNRSLEGLPPVQMLGSDVGALVVDQLLGRLEHGLIG
jgi:putative toxin-antitoxin system antitoxin component (TIGR02293 family)